MRVEGQLRAVDGTDLADEQVRLLEPRERSSVRPRGRDEEEPCRRPRSEPTTVESYFKGEALR